MTISSIEMYNALNVAGVTATIDTYDSNPAIWDDDIIPQDFTGNGINFYMSTNLDLRTEWQIYTFTVNCRASKKKDALTIANAVITAVNRTSYDGYYINCFALPTIAPEDDTDDYNTIVQCTLKKR